MGQLFKQQLNLDFLKVQLTEEEEEQKYDEESGEKTRQNISNQLSLTLN